MVSYAYAVLGRGGSGAFGSTDPQLVEWYLDELKQVVPASKVYEDKSNGELVSVSAMDGLTSQEHSGIVALGWSAMKRLCQDEWEPFAENGYSVSIGNG